MILDSSEIRDTVADHDVPISPTTLSPQLEAELEEDRRAAVEAASDWDPLDLYQREHERDEALEELASAVSPAASIGVSLITRHERVCGNWERSHYWLATITHGDRTVSQTAETAFLAVGKARDAWSRRPRPTGPAALSAA